MTQGIALPKHYWYTKQLTQLILAWSDSTIETLEKGVKYVQSYQLKHQNNVSDINLVSLLLTWIYLTPFCSVCIVNF